ncbi:putative Polyketide synthase PksL [Streptomyces aurantiacus JA 4570]|uniref:Putative Polyketide synthase PksL n=1 Tax=Streptomyces aurantiacus JA 4570 TaxID=1286094 RepID=S4AIW5_9ACTN|nr:putative Polyketide synthase PksL [Streptomyces aurantiacus JA 4570]
MLLRFRPRCRRRGLGYPVPLACERVGGGADPARGVGRRGVQGLPVGRRAARPQFEELDRLAAPRQRGHGLGEFLGGDDGERLAVPLGVAAADALDRGVAAQVPLQLLGERGEGVGDDTEPLVHGLTAGLQGVREVRGGHVGRAVAGGCPLPGEAQQFLGVGAQPLGVLRGEREHLRAASGRGRAPVGVLGHDQVRVRAARAEGGDSGDPGVPAAVDDGPLPVAQFLVDDERGAGEVDGGVERRRVQGGGDPAVLELEEDLGEPGDAGGALAVPDVGLRRAEVAARPFPGATRSLRAVGALRGVRAVGALSGGGGECLGQSGDLDGVAELGAGAVRLDVADGPRVDAGLAQGLPDGGLLGARVGHGVAVGATAVRHTAALDDAVDVVSVALGVTQRLEQDDADALARDVAVAADAEALAVTLAGDELTCAQAQVLVRVDGDVDASRERQLRAAAAQIAAGQLHGRERARAHGVHGHAGAVQVQHEGDAVRDARVTAAESVGVATTGALAREQQLVLPPHHPGVHADLPGTAVTRGAREPLTGVPGVLHGRPGVFQEQPLLRVQVVGLVGRDVEEQRVEAVHLGDEAAPLAVVPPGHGAVPLVVLPPVPAVFGDLDDAVASGAQVVPELPDITGFGVAAGQADDGDVEGGAPALGPAGLVLDPAVAVRRFGDRRRGRCRVGSPCRPLPGAGGEQCLQGGPVIGEEVAGEFREGVVLEQQRLRQGAERLLQSGRQLGREDRVHAVRAEGLAVVHLARRQLGEAAQLVLEEGHRAGAQGVLVRDGVRPLDRLGSGRGHLFRGNRSRQRTCRGDGRRGLPCRGDGTR